MGLSTQVFQGNICIFRFHFGQFADFSPRLTPTTCSASAGFECEAASRLLWRCLSTLFPWLLPSLGEIALNKIAKLSQESVWDHLHPLLGQHRGQWRVFAHSLQPREEGWGTQSKKAQRKWRCLKMQLGLVGILSNYFGNGFRIWQLFAVWQTVSWSIQNPPLHSSECHQPGSPGSWTFHPVSPVGTPPPRAGAAGRTHWFFQNHFALLTALKKKWTEAKCNAMRAAELWVSRKCQAHYI